MRKVGTMQLRDIYLVRIGKEEAVSRISGEQQKLLDRIGVKLEEPCFIISRNRKTDT